MSNFFDVIEPDRPYFDGVVAGLQSPVQRYLMMPSVVHALGIADRPISVLEVGSWIGTSALVWAEAIDLFCSQKGSVLCVDTWAPYFGEPEEGSIPSPSYDRMTRLAESGLAYQLFLHNARCGPASSPIRHFRGVSADVLPYLADRSFDVVYIDGDHAYDRVRADLLQGDRLVRDGGFLCGDDLELQWHDVDQENTARRSGADMTYDPKTRSVHHPGVTRAVGELFGPVPYYHGFWALQRAGGTYRRVDLRTSPTFIPRHLAGHCAAAGIAVPA